MIDVEQQNPFSRVVKAVAWFGFCAVMAALVMILVDSSVMFGSRDRLLYTTAILLFALTLLVSLWLCVSAQRLIPSFVLYAFFASFAVLGPAGAREFENTYGLYHGIYSMDSAYPCFIWAVGTCCLFLGIAAAHKVGGRRSVASVTLWNIGRVRIALALICGVAVVATLVVLLRLGNVPLLQNNARAELSDVTLIGGELPVKLSRLWLILAVVSPTFALLRLRTVYYAALTLVSIPALMLYGQRNYAIVALICIALLYYKERAVRVWHGVLALILFCFFLGYAEVRGGTPVGQVDLPQQILMNSAREWREYAIVVNDVARSHRYYGDRLFLGAFMPLMPKQLWEVVGVDKDYVTREYGANFVFGEQFGDPVGIRIGTIGEAFAGYGLYYGVCAQLLVFGILFGLLERLYLQLDSVDARLSIVVFFLALLMILPITTLYVTTSYGVFFGSVLFVVYLATTFRVRLLPLNGDDGALVQYSQSSVPTPLST